MTRKSIFISGAARGIGRETAELFARNGYLVGAYDISPVDWADNMPNIIAGHLDVTSQEDWARALANFPSHTGGTLAILLNNAGFLIAGPFNEDDRKREDLMVDVNVKGVYKGCHAAFPYLLATPPSQVISMCSASGIVGPPDMALYSATKFAVRGLTEALNVEWDQYDIRVVDMMPLYVNSKMLDGVSTAGTRRMGVRLEPKDVAKRIWGVATGITTKLPTVHHPVGKQCTAFYLTEQVSPNVIARLVNRILTYGK